MTTFGPVNNFVRDAGSLHSLVACVVCGDDAELVGVDLDTGSTIAWPADQPIERQVRRP